MTSRQMPHLWAAGVCASARSLRAARRAGEDGADGVGPGRPGRAGAGGRTREEGPSSGSRHRGLRAAYVGGRAWLTVVCPCTGPPRLGPVRPLPPESVTSGETTRRTHGFGGARSVAKP